MITLKIDNLSHDGKGIGRIEGKTIFVAGAIPGDEVSAYITQEQASFSEATLKEILVASPDRVEPFCELYNQCGGCQLQHASIEAQRRFKTDNFITALKKAVDMRKCKIAPALTSEDTGYRRRARFVYGRNKSNKEANFGFRAKGSVDIIDVPQCPLLTPALNEALTLKREQRIPEASRSLKEVTALETPTGVVWSDETTSANYSFSLKQQAYQFSLPSDGFIQVNSELNEQMIQQAIDWCQLESHHSVLDLFCGVGNFTLPIASQVAKVVGVEGDAQLIEHAKKNADANQLGQTQFYKTDLFNDCSGYQWFHGEKYDRILLDPGRQGAHQISQILGRLKAEIIVYVSCNAATLIRDLKLLEAQNYQIRKAGFMDMFPHTSHAEVMVQLVKIKKLPKKKKQDIFKI